MAMQKAYERINWENYPSMNTPVNEENLNRLDKATDEIDGRVITLDTTKFDKTEAAGLFKDVSLNSKTGVITFTTYSGAVKTIDTLLEKIAINFDFNEETQKIIINLEDGTVKEIDISAFIKPNEFLESETVAWIVDGQTVKAIVKEGSIEEKHLRPNYLAEIKVEAAKAEAARTGAETAQAEAKKSQTAAATSATQSATSAKSSADSATASAGSAATATEQATSASNSAKAAQTSATNAAQSASNSASSAEVATRQATAASGSASTATTQANAAKESATQAADYAKEAESYAHGGTGTRPNEGTDSAEYYYEQVKHLIQGMNGIVNMGTVKFADLPQSPEVNQMYNISDAFTSDNRFQDGSGIHYAAGNNVVWTGNGMWDVLAASQVLSVNGKTGAVTVTKADVGLGNVDNTADANKNVNSAKTATTATTATTANKVANALKFTGGSTVTYDGSTAQTVAIPTSLPANGGNADTVDGYHVCSAYAGSAGVWGRIPRVGATDGVMEVGKYIDFHSTSTGTSDYDVRITADTSGLELSGTTRGTFSGNLIGNATNDGNGNNIATTYALKTDLGGLTFAMDANGKWGYRIGGAGTVIPFKTGGGDVTIIYMPEFIIDPRTPYLATKSTLTFTDENYKIVFEDDTACDLLLSEIPDTAFIGIRLSTDNNGYILQVSEMKSNFSAVLPAFIDGGFSLTMSGSWPTSPIFCQIAPILFAKTETFPAGKQYSGMLKMVEKST